MEAAAIAEADLWEVWTESVLGTLAPSMHVHLQALFCHGCSFFILSICSWFKTLHLKDYEHGSGKDWWSEESAEDSPNMHYNLCAYLVFSQPCGEMSSIFWQAYFEWTLRQQKALKAFMKELIAKNVVPADSWPRLQAKWFMEDWTSCNLSDFQLCFMFPSFFGRTIKVMWALGNFRANL